MKISILDCTLRDGGYLNEWSFAKEEQSILIDKISSAGIEFIEIGWLKQQEADNKTFFKSKDGILSVLSNINIDHTKILLMLDVNDFYDGILEDLSSSIFGVRLAFYKEDLKKINLIITELNKVSLRVFLQPMNVFSYNSNEMMELMAIANRFNVYSISIVDSFGYYNLSIISQLIKLFNTELLNGISINIHLHNNQKQALTNVYTVLTSNIDRQLIIDCSIGGVGRGAGNVSTESFIMLLNDIIKSDYDVMPILSASYSVLSKNLKMPRLVTEALFFLSSIFRLHPNYLTYIEYIEEFSFEQICNYLSSIPIQYLEDCTKSSALLFLEDSIYNR